MTTTQQEDLIMYIRDIAAELQENTILIHNILENFINNRIVIPADDIDVQVLRRHSSIYPITRDINAIKYDIQTHIEDYLYYMLTLFNEVYKISYIDEVVGDDFRGSSIKQLFADLSRRTFRYLQMLYTISHSTNPLDTSLQLLHIKATNRNIRRVVAEEFLENLIGG